MAVAFPTIYHKKYVLIMKIYLATFLHSLDQGQVLTRKNKRNRLISYHYIIESKTGKYLRKYIKKGSIE